MYRRRIIALLLSLSLVVVGGGAATAGPTDLDPSFGGGDGVALLDKWCRVSIVSVADDRIYTAGNCDGAGSGEFSSWIRVSRVDGSTVAQVGFRAWCWGFWPEITDILQLPGGDVLVAGYANSTSMPGYVWTGRFTDDLEPVESWGTLERTCDGTFTAPGFRSLEWYDFTSLAGASLDSQGRLVLGGAVFKDSAVLRLMPNGTPDGAFGNDGLFRYRTPEIGERPRDIAVTESDDVLVGGEAAFSPYGSYRGYVTKVASDGSLDPAWGSDGTRMFAGERYRGYLRAQHIHALPGGKVLVGLVNRTENAAGSSRVGVARLLSDGSNDGTFAGTGRVDMDCRGDYYPAPMTDLTVHPQASGGYRIQAYLACRSDGKVRPRIAGWLDTGEPAPAFGADALLPTPWGQPIISADTATDGGTVVVTWAPALNRMVLAKLGS